MGYMLSVSEEEKDEQKHRGSIWNEERRIGREQIKRKGANTRQSCDENKNMKERFEKKRKEYSEREKEN